ncbi:MAG: hypothetical protein Q7S52_02320 [bacterium]|nr:hypothetical protein [bacterium]
MNFLSKNILPPKLYFWLSVTVNGSYFVAVFISPYIKAYIDLSKALQLSLFIIPVFMLIFGGLLLLEKLEKTERRLVYIGWWINAAPLLFIIVGLFLFPPEMKFDI